MTSTKHRATLRTVSQFAQSRQDFDCNGTLDGRFRPYPSMGRLPVQYRDGLNKASDAADFYVVRSYATPIAWFANGQWHVPNVKYSVTTSRHLSALRLGLDWQATDKNDPYVKVA